MHANLKAVLSACKGEYIAVLEGDDYWTSKDKLQKQVDLMDLHSDFSECFHLVKTVYEDDRESTLFPKTLKKDVYVLDDVVSEFFIPTPSVLFRKSAINSFPPSFYQMKNPDWMIHVLCAEKGKIGFINEVMAVYRVHSGGVWSGIGRVKVLENTIISAKVINKYLNYQYDILLKRRMSGWHLEVSVILMRSLNCIQSGKHFFNGNYLRILLILRKLISWIKSS